eukprot:1137613-Pelagomonas_calceolata.AAC.4
MQSTHLTPCLQSSQFSASSIASGLVFHPPYRHLWFTPVSRIKQDRCGCRQDTTSSSGLVSFPLYHHLPLTPVSRIKQDCCKGRQDTTSHGFVKVGLPPSTPASLIRSGSRIKQEYCECGQRVRIMHGWRWLGPPVVPGAAGHLLRHSAALKELLPLRNIKQGYDVAVLSDQEHGQCTLRCKGCGEVLIPNNPLHTCKQHSSSCKRPGEEELMITWMMAMQAPAALSSARGSHLLPHTCHQLRSRMLSTRSCSALSSLLRPPPGS